MTYEEAIDFLYAQLPMFSRIGAAAYKEDIHNTVALCGALGNPQNRFKSIHIAGTNGKGSTSSMLSAMLQQQGFKTGLYTSPHIKEFGERIRINGRKIDRDFVVSFTEKTKTLCKNIGPSFFELTVAMAFEYFAVHEVDIAVIETGLGGRLDSTNIINPILSVITNIGYDHTNLLGNTLEAIAFEKAGIIKTNTPVVIGETCEATKQVFEKKAREMNAPVIYADELYEARLTNSNSKSLHCSVTDTTNQHTEDFVLDLNGNYQLKNLRTVLAAEKMLAGLGFEISEQNEKYALSHVKAISGLQGRWDVVSENPTVIHDVAHNKDGIHELLEQLKVNHACSEWHFVIGFVNDKDISSVLDLLPSHSTYYFTNAHIPRAMPYQQLQSLAAEKKLHGEGFDSVNEAIAAAKRNADKNDVVVVCGSFFILAEVDQ